ncbi:hypothetical protein VIGAN_03143500 [Vigna angularis var. angularis]|uniref:GDSL esterase/lipase n=1 Tax=Vigna angularis var. angularis TaxID=157739 RepID=A0A0S3RM28_PHAAN|nr:hypothetical protein VIGAN_03143500 [Vigna angularis var. angularis]
MEKSLKILWVICIIITQQLALLANASNSRKRIVPALYVFGDSTVDAGNNNNINTLAKANAFPYGIDFNNCSTGRFSNGRTLADLIAIRLGLPMPPPYLGVNKSRRHQVIRGINYASASCGILNSTRAEVAENTEAESTENFHGLLPSKIADPTKLNLPPIQESTAIQCPQSTSRSNPTQMQRALSSQRNPYAANRPKSHLLKENTYALVLPTNRCRITLPPQVSLNRVRNCVRHC